MASTQEISSREGSVLTCPAEDGAIGRREGERLEQLFEQRCDELRREGRADSLAVDAPDLALTYDELDARASQLARYLVRHQGVGPGDRVGLLFDRAVDGYVGMLAVMKLRAAYVPLDTGFPADRLSYIVSDAGVRTVLSRRELTADLGETVTLVCIDEVAAEIGAESRERLAGEDVGHPADDLCYVIYTSGTTGRPKGVAIRHASICNFVRVAAETYGIERDDRVYQGLTIAFDFSIEEIWVAWMVGATLVPKPDGPSLVGADLGAFLKESGVTALCCVPTLLATLDEDLPELRFLLVSGETCPQDLVDRWHRPDRRFLNVYGPTEATVSATWTVLQPGKPVTIGVPLPTYSVVILEPEADRAAPPGELGEIGIAGVGLAAGYLNRPDLTARAFIPDFLPMPDNPSGRIYRTGDLGRINDDGEIEHHGRIDTQVKLRGYRIELAEIESVLRRVPGIGHAVVDTYQSDELVAYYTQRPDAQAADPSLIYEHLSERLPAYMVPAYLERLDELPIMVSGKIDRQSLPRPAGSRRLAAEQEYEAPATDTESLLAGLLSTVLGVERISAESHFFDDLGANSLLMARFNAALRTSGSGLPAVSMRDVYGHPTVRQLAVVLSEARSASDADGRARSPEGVAKGTPRYVLCGALQLLAVLALLSPAAVALDVGGAWLTAAHGALGVYSRALAFGAGVLVATGVLPIVAKWVLIGRWKPQRIRVWSLAYLRFWIVKSLVVYNPLIRLSAGSPLYPLYLRALGGKIGRGAVFFTQHVPVCTDLLTVGAGTVIRKDSFVNCYRARAGVIEIGPVTLGEHAFVGERTVLDIDSSIEDHAQLGHASCLHSGQVVPAGQCWHGSPAEPAGADHDYQGLPPARCHPLRAAVYCAARVLTFLFVAGPLEAIGATLLLTHHGFVSHLTVADGLIVSAATMLGFFLGSLLLAVTVPRLLSRALKPGQVYPLYGFHYALQRIVSGSSNNPLLTLLFGDSAAIVAYLRAIGWRFGVVEQTGSNFGTEVKHEVPGLSEVRTGTMVSDGLSMMNAEFSSGSFRVHPVVIGRRNYLGNEIAFPPDGRTGANCLLATKAMVPTRGPERSDVGLLGSPCFEIPRSVERDRRFEHLGREPERSRRVAAKTRHNAGTVALHLLVRYLFASGIVLLALSPLGGEGPRAFAGTLATAVLELGLSIALFVLVERVVTHFRPLEPKFCSIYQIDFWRHERYWKVPATGYIQMFNGTPFKNVVWRLLGVSIGRRVFDDGCQIVERTMVEIGSESTLNMGCTLQSHSLEEGVFKSDNISIGRGCTIGTGALVNYGVVMEDESSLDADSFLMKGSYLVRGARWRGNPADEMGIEARDACLTGSGDLMEMETHSTTPEAARQR